VPIFVSLRETEPVLLGDDHEQLAAARRSSIRLLAAVLVVALVAVTLMGYWTWQLVLWDRSQGIFP